MNYFNTTAFNDCMVVWRLPNAAAEQLARRSEQMQVGLKKAIDIPLTIMKLGDRVWDALCEVARHGNPASRLDVARWVPEHWKPVFGGAIRM